MPISSQSTEFLFENYAQNSRDWFREHRGTYKSVVEEPMLALAGQVLPAVLAIDPHITADPRRCLSRIWLDMRINRSGMLFRDHMWLVFRRGKGMAYPSYYFEFSPRGYGWGVGYYAVPTPVLETVRRWVLRGDARFLAAEEALARLPQFQLAGEEYKRPKYPDAPPERQPWLNRKSLSVNHEGKDAKVLFSEGLAELLCADFQKLAPIYRLMLEAHLGQTGQQGDEFA